MIEHLARDLNERERVAFLTRDLAALSEILADDYVVTPYDNQPRGKRTVRLARHAAIVERGREPTEGSGT